MAVSVLGPLEVDDAALRPQERRLLCALVLRRGAIVTPHELAIACWGESPPKTWWQQVKTSVTRVRRVLGHAVIVTDSLGYGFGWEGDTVDAVRFERYVHRARAHVGQGEDDRAAHAYDEALTLWRGRAFDDLANWQPALIEADRLAGIRTTADEEYLGARLRLGDAAGALPDAERLVRQEPLREARWRLLALANYHADRQAEALAVLRSARERLRDELGIDPGAMHDELEAAILRHDPAIAAPARHPSASADCPYPGLRPFGSENADLFFGRERETDVLVGRLSPGEIITVTGPSGSGKSSIVRAGVSARLASDDRVIAIVQPTPSALTTLRSWRSNSDATDVLVVDQFEELWRADPAFVDEFAAAIGHVLARGVAVIIAVRSDFLDDATSLPHIGELVGRRVFAVAPLSSIAVRAAIELPAERAGLRVEAGLTELMVRDGGGATSLPYLSHALAETWQRREGNTLTVAGYTAAGGIAGAIAKSAEDLYQQLSPAERAMCQTVILRLVDRNVEGASVRRRAEVAPLVEDPRRRSIIDQLVSARLLAVDGPTVTLAHEAIAEAWPRLDGWLQENADSDRVFRDLQASATRWVDAGRTDDELARGARLQTYLAWRESAHPDLTALESDFLEAGEATEQAALRALTTQASRDRRRVRALRWALGGAAGLLVVALVAGGVAVVRERDARTAEAVARTTAVAASAQSLVASNRDLAALLGAELYRRDATDPMARSALVDALAGPETPTAKVTFGEDERVSAAAIPGTNTVLAIIDKTPSAPGGGKAPRVELWDAVTATRIRSLPVSLPPNKAQLERYIVIDPQGRRALVISPVFWADYPGDCCLSTISSIDLESGRMEGSTRELGLGVSQSAAMAPDGATLTLLDIFSGEPVWVDTQTLAFTTNAARAEHNDAPQVSFAIAMTTDGEVAVGLPADGRGSIQFYDDVSRKVIRSVSLPADLATWSMSPGPDGLLVSTGPDGIALIDSRRAEVLWTRGQVPNQYCQGVRVIGPDSALCVAPDSWEFRLSDGVPTGRTLDVQAVWVNNLDTLADGSVVVVNHWDTPFLERFPIDGTGPLSRLVARGQQVAGDFLDERTIITAPIVRRDGLLSQSMTRWDIEDDRRLPAEPDELYVISQGVARRWTQELATTVLADAVASGADPVTGDFDEPGDQLIPVDGGAGDLSFAIANDWIVPFDPRTGHTTGPPMSFDGKEFHWRWVMVHELPSEHQAVVTWWDREDSETHTAVFDLSTGQELLRGLQGEVASIPLADNRILSADNSGLQLNSLDLEPVRELSKPENEANVFELSDDGSTLLLEAWNRGAALYDVPSSTKLGRDIEVTSPDWESAHLSPDGLTLVTNSPSGVLVWDLSGEAMATAACRLAGRNLSPTEWETYFPGEPYAETCGA